MANTKVKAIVKLSIEEIAKSGIHVFFSLKVNGKKCRFLLDTGASKTVVSKDWFEKNVGKEKLKTIKQETSGLHSAVAESYYGKLDVLEFGLLAVKNYTVAAVDLSHVNSMYAKFGLKKIQGILGSDVLKKQNAVIDYKAETLTLG